MIVADDLATPAIDALAGSGIKLEQYYVLPLCTPTRSAILSSRYPLRTGLQTSTISPAKPYGLHLNATTLADELRSQYNYATHGLGKWHLGFCREEFVPTRRGFDTFDGYMNGAEKYFTHQRPPDRVAFTNFSSGFDFYTTAESKALPVIDWSQNASGPLQNVDPSRGECYSAHALAHRAAAIVQAHDAREQPLFLYLALQSVHSPYEAPQSYVDQYAWMNDTAHYTPISAGRPLYGGMVAALDEAVANVTAALRAKDGGAFFNNTLVVFTTDNGGVGRGNNWPLRGRKATLWEGGTRGVGFVAGWGLDPALAGGESSALMHAVDWMPTLLAAAEVGAACAAGAAGARAQLPEGIDGVSAWPALSRNASSARGGLVYNIEPTGKGTTGMKCGAVRLGCHKLIRGNPGAGTYDPQPQARPPSARPTFRPLPAASGGERGGEGGGGAADEAVESGPWLFDLCADPTERTNLFNQSSVSGAQQKLEAMLTRYHREMVPALYNTMADDWRFNPSLHNGTWTWFGCEAD
eukprot:g140.t1